MRRLIIIFILVPGTVFAESVSIPRDHFLGVSRPCATIVDARNEAFYDVAKQIIRTIGGLYSVKFKSQFTLDGDSYHRRVSDIFNYQASGFLSEIERNIVESRYTKTGRGVVYEMLVHVPKRLLVELRRLSRGAKVLVRSVDDTVYEVREVNGVTVVLTEAVYSVVETHRFAKIIDYYVMKVPLGDSRKFTKPLAEPVHLKNRSVKTIKLMVPTRNIVADVLFGTKRTTKITLIGTDEVGRTVQVRIE